MGSDTTKPARRAKAKLWITGPPNKNNAVVVSTTFPRLIDVRERVSLMESTAPVLICLPCTSPFLVLDSNLWQTFAALVEIANLYQRWPQFDRTLNHTDGIVHDP